MDKLRNRSKLDIIHDILTSATVGVKKTHIMARANLSSEQMNFYFTTLLNHSLLDVQRDNDNNQIYRTTHKGIRFLQCCVNIKSLISPSVPPKVGGDLLYL